MKTGLIENHINKAEKEEMGTICDPEQDQIIEFLKQSLPVQHHFEQDKLLEPSDE